MPASFCWARTRTAHSSSIASARITRRLIEEKYDVLRVRMQNAGGEWFDAAPNARTVRTAKAYIRGQGSVPDLLGRAGWRQFLLLFPRDAPPPPSLITPRLNRAIGAVYWQKFERREHYYEAGLANQFDALIHIDRTHALPNLRE